MNNEYFTNLASDPSVTSLVARGMVSINLDDQQISFQQAEQFKIKPLFVEEHEEGAIIIKLDEAQYIFYLSNFGQIDKVSSTASEINSIVVGLLDENSDATAHLLSMGGCSAVRIVDGNHELESTSVFSKGILNNIQWSFRNILKHRIQKKNLKVSKKLNRESSH